jgi:hypothetical protein
MHTEAPDAPSVVSFVEHTSRSLTLSWELPYSDGLWIYGHELQLVPLQDKVLPGGSSDGPLCRCAARGRGGGSGVSPERSDTPPEQAHRQARSSVTSATRGGSSRRMSKTLATRFSSADAGVSSAGDSDRATDATSSHGTTPVPVGAPSASAMARRASLRPRQHQHGSGGGPPARSRLRDAVHDDLSPRAPQSAEEVMLSDASGGAWVLTGGHTPRHVVNGLHPFTAYRVRVRVRTVAGWSEYGPPSVHITAGEAVLLMLRVLLRSQ